MASYSTNEFRGGLKIMIDGDPCAIIENEMVKPGKGQAFSRVRFRNLKTGRVIERTFKSGESVEAADVVVHAAIDLYDLDGMEPSLLERSTAWRRLDAIPASAARRRLAERLRLELREQPTANGEQRS